MEDQKEITIQSYDKTADEYFKVVSEFDLLPEIFEFTKLIKQSGKILDLGCGPGHHSKYFSGKGFDVTGIDLSSKMIEIAKKESIEVNFQVMDIFDLQFKANSFDAIWASASLLHVPKKNIRSVLINLREILINGGVLYISLKVGDGSKVFIDTRYGGVNKFYVYYRPKEIQSLLKIMGFKIIEIIEKNKRTKYDTNSWIHVFCSNVK